MVPRASAMAIGGLVYFVMAWASLEWRGDLSPSLLWLATGATTTVALFAGPQRWWVLGGAVVAGFVAGPVLFDDQLPEMLGPIAGNAAETALILLLLPAVLGASLQIRTTMHGLWVVAIIVGAAGAAGLLAIVGDSSKFVGDSFEAWFRWTLGNTVGEVLMVPLFVFRDTAVISRSRGRIPLELVVSLGMIIGVAVAAVIVDSPLIFLLIPLVLWIAIRFGPLVAAPVSMVTVVSIWAATARGHGPFIELGDDPALQAELFTLSMGSCVIVGGAHAVRAWNDNRRLAAVVTAIPDIIFIRERGRGPLITSWIPPGDEALAAALDPSAIDVSASVQIQAAPPPEPTMVSADEGATLERRTVPVDDARELDLYRDVTREQRALRELRRRREALEDARWAERERLGKALHDSPVQLLAAALLRLHTARSGGPDVDDNLQKVQELTEQAMTELREKLDELIPPDVAGGAIVDGLGHLARQLFDHDVEIALHTDEVTAPPEVCEALFLIGREAVSNAALHARAGRIEVDLTERDGLLVLQVSDDGVGMSGTQRVRTGLGLDLMRERARERGGEVLFEDGPDGAVVTASIPAGAPGA